MESPGGVYRVIIRACRSMLVVSGYQDCYFNSIQISIYFDFPFDPSRLKFSRDEA